MTKRIRPKKELRGFQRVSLNPGQVKTVYFEIGKKDVLMKVANNRDVSETVNITLNGVNSVTSKAISTIFTGKPEDVNSIKEPEKIIPLDGTFDAGNNFNFTFPAYSVTLLSVSY